MFGLSGGSAPYRDFFLAVAVISIVFIAVAVNSVLGALGAVFVPMPILYYYSKLGRLHGLLVFILSLTITVITLRALGFQTGVIYLFFLGSIGLVLSEVLRRNWSIEKTVAYSVSILLILSFVILLYLSLISGKAPWGIIGTHMSAIVQENIDLYSRTGVSTQYIELMKENSDRITSVLTGLLPSLILVGAAFFIWLNILGGKWLFRKRGMWYPDFGDLSLWKTLDKTVWFVVIAGVFILIPSEGFRILGLNIVIVLLFIYMLQGLAIISFFFKRKNVPVVFRAFGYFLIFAQQFLIFIVAGLGLIDTWTDFRKLGKKLD
ncbi:MAG: YybS family protein [Deltaproteobacteria bacterium]|nr:YybS family protein [Deltaproteobacteria bacterium]